MQGGKFRYVKFRGKNYDLRMLHWEFAPIKSCQYFGKNPIVSI